MIISRIDGGLGNQMFQVAYGMFLANKHKTQLVLDTNAYASAPQHGYLLDRYALTAKVAQPQQLARIPRRYRLDRRFKIHNLLSGNTMLGGIRRHKESTFGFNPRHLHVSDNRYLVGYWQSEQFFPGMRIKLLEEFQLGQPMTDLSRRVAERIRGSKSIAVHVRRGDYVTSTAAAQIYCHLELDYYRRAIRAWAERHVGIEVFIFSNDIAWCRRHLHLGWPTTFVDHNTVATAHEDLELMRLAGCCAIANSTFSWWAAWLNQRPEKVVYAPSRWFRPQTLDGSSIIPADWCLLMDAEQQQAA